MRERSVPAQTVGGPSELEPSPRNRRVGFSLLLFSACVAFLFGGCAGAPPRAVLPPAAPPAVPPPAVSRPQAPLPSVPTEAASVRPVRVLLGGPQKGLSVTGESIRAWSFAGALVASGKGAVSLSVRGEKIGWGGEKTLSSPIDIDSPSGLRFGGKELVGRIRVSAQKGQLLAVAVVPLEEYVKAVVSREAPPSFQPEALSALAVAVRTYALLAMEKPREPTHDVVAGVEDQIFEGMEMVGEVFRRAAESTRGEVLAYRGVLARTVFHSTCGGRTENAKDAWGTDVPYLRSLACDDCLDSPMRRWDYRMTAKEGKRVALLLGIRAEETLRLDFVEWSSTGRASRVRLSSGRVSRDVAAAVFRREAGYSRVKSLKMSILPVGDGWVFGGQGYGHGVGMCQWGANGMAKNGKTYREILARYYPGTTLARSIP